MFLGIDLGTSCVKAVLVDEEQRVVAWSSSPLEVSRPRPLWSEQDPEDWWQATCNALDRLQQSNADDLRAVQGIGLSGQMHGATLLDSEDRVLRPAILWNDGRSGEACRELERRLPSIRSITGNRVMPGFTAPKLLWIAAHEPDVFARTARVLLPKDWLRLRMSGDHAGEMSDAAGTLWLDVAERRWSDAVLAACDLREEQMPTLVEGSEPTGCLLPELARRWGMDREPIIAGGAGDQAAGAIGAGVIRPGQAFVSLGTSGVYFVAGDTFAPNPEQAVHAFCHCLPERWHQMSVMLSAASCLAWVTSLTGARDEATLLEEVAAREETTSAPLFLPYLSGERTPHDDPHAKGVFFGLTHEHGRADLGWAVLEGVALALADGQEALLAAGSPIGDVTVIGGGARSRLWGRLLAAALDRPMIYPAGAEIGPAFGAARLARLATTGERAAEICVAPPAERVIEPEPPLAARCRERRVTFRRVYHALRDTFPEFT